LKRKLIFPSESDIDALQSQHALRDSIQRFLDVNEGFSRRLREMEDSLDLKSTLSKCKLNGASVVESEGDEGASDAGTITPSTAQRSAGGDWRFDFEDDLENSRPYRMCGKNDCNNSFATSACYVHSWSIFSGLSLADISAISVISLPFTSEDIQKIKDWNLKNSAHDIFARPEPNDPSGAPDIDMLSPSAEQSSLVQDTQNEETAEKEIIFSKTSTHNEERAEKEPIFKRASFQSAGSYRSIRSVGSRRSEREGWSSFYRGRGSMSSGTIDSLLYGDIPEWHKGIDHVDYQKSVKALSDDYEVLRKEFLRGRRRVTTENLEARCKTCGQPTDSLFLSIKENTWTCGLCPKIPVN